MVYVPFSFATKCLLMLLLATDAALISAHLIHIYTSFMEAPEYSIEQDRGYAEIFQYIKFFWIVLLLGALTLTTREWIYGVWMLLYLYLLGDDASQFHERGGYFITAELAYQPKWGLRAQDFGELSMTLIAFTLFSLLAIKAYLAASAVTRRAIKGYAALLVLLAFFGVAMDMLHVIAGGDSNLMMGVLEDGGELIAASLTCWYSFHLLEHKGVLPVHAWKSMMESLLKTRFAKRRDA